MKTLNRLRRRIHQNFDHYSVVLERKLSQTPNFDDNVVNGISAIVVNFNTLHLTKLMLFTLVEHLSSDIDRIIIIDNGSKDGSYEFLSKLAAQSKGIKLSVPPKRLRHHGSGLRWGIDTLYKSREQGKSKYYLICDSDIIFLRSDLIQDIKYQMEKTNAGLAGEIQHDVGEPYVHPSCMLIAAKAYHNPQVWPFLVHGAPALKLQQSMRQVSIKIEDFPVRSNEYIIHRGRGTITGIQKFAPKHAHATVINSAHFHGNVNGELIWEQTEAKYETILNEDNEDKAIEYLIQRFK